LIAEYFAYKKQKNAKNSKSVRDRKKIVERRALALGLRNTWVQSDF